MFVTSAFITSHISIILFIVKGLKIIRYIYKKLSEFFFNASAVVSVGGVTRKEPEGCGVSSNERASKRGLTLIYEYRWWLN